MSAQPVSPVKPEEESVTTREEMDFDDPTSPEHTGGRVSPITKKEAETNTSTSPAPRPRVAFQEQTDEIPPSKPPRPADPMAQAEHTLIEAFPTIDTKVVKAVLVASGGKVEPAFNALLGMSDPDFQPEAPQPPPKAPRPRQPRNQLEADELYARQLAEEYDVQHQGTRYNQREPGNRGPNAQRPEYGDDERERSFLDDDLPEIGRSIQQGFMETQQKVNSWIQNFKKRLDGEDDEEDLYSGTQGRQNFGPSQADQLRGIQRTQDTQRRSVEQQRYDADHRAFSDEDFSRLELRDDEGPPPQLPRRPPQSGSVDEVEHAERTDSKNKWQSLTSISPHPEDDNDPFALGDDEEKEEKAEEKSEDIRKEDTERLKDAARKSVSEADKTSTELEENKTTGTKNADAEKILTK